MMSHVRRKKLEDGKPRNFIFHIVTVARKIPENVLQEDPKLLMWFDRSVTRSGEDA